MAARNPFSPTFGASPPVLAGRDDLLDDLDDALEAGPAHPDYTTLLIGGRGTGKTVMLNEVEGLARRRGWLTLSETASTPGLIDRLERGVRRSLRQILDGPQRQIRSVTAGGFGLEFEATAKSDAPLELREALVVLGDVLASNGTGLLITLDELQSGEPGEIREFGTVLQHVTRREQRPIAFIGAALPQIEDSLLADDAATFLQRCARYDIERLDNEAARIAIAEPIERHGATIDADALDLAVAATSGYPFMVQLVGFHSWKTSTDPLSGITSADVAAGIDEAERLIGRLVLSPTWRSLSEVDQRFLLAMATDSGESRLGEIADRLGVSRSYVSVYRHRLIKAGMILPKGRGRVAFAHRSARSWLRNRAEYTQERLTDG